MSTIKDESIEKFTREDSAPIEMNIETDLEDEDNRVYLWLCWGLVGIIALSYLFV
jgi:hypothetical protein